MTSKRLAGQVAIVYGGGTCGEGMGNGKASAILYAREGAKVVVVDLVLGAAEETAMQIREEGGDAIALAADVTVAKQVDCSVQAALGAYGRIDVLHNNVGIAELGGPVEQEEAVWDRVMNANLKSMFLTCKHVLPVMEKQGRGVITNISSLASIRYAGTPWISYSASKGGVNQFTQAVALQYAHSGIRVNAILPGLIDTPMTIEPHRGSYSDLSEMIDSRHARCPTGRMGEAWDVAQAAVFLASDEARYITAAMIPVDGGISGTVS